MKLKFYHNPMCGVVEFLIYEKLPDGKRRICLPVELKTEVFPDYHAGIKPTFSIPDYEAKELLKDLAEQMDQHGIRTDKDAKIEGTLEASRAHLEDMRRLVFERIGGTKNAIT